MMILVARHTSIGKSAGHYFHDVFNKFILVVARYSRLPVFQNLHSADKPCSPIRRRLDVGEGRPSSDEPGD